MKHDYRRVRFKQIITSWYFLIPTSFFSLIVLVEILRIFQLNNGVFLYTLDDPYIHLTLATNIANGHYGLYPKEFTSPISNILWPFILAPFHRVSFFVWLPFILNFLISLVILGIFSSLYLSISSKDNHHSLNIKPLLLLTLLIPALNLVGLLFSGMEHSLQMALSLLAIAGFITTLKQKHFSIVFATILVLGPLVRYENLCLSIPILFVLSRQGYFKKSLITLLILLTSLGIFSLFLLYHGEPLLPVSILNKNNFLESNRLGFPVFHQLFKNLFNIQGIIFYFSEIVLLGFIFFSKISKDNKMVLSILSMAFFLQLIFGRFDWYHRYEMYLWACLWYVMLHLYFSSKQASKRLSSYHFLIFFMILGSFSYFTVLISLAKASNNIYKQQYQMKQFVMNWVRGPVAANDIGWLSFENPYYVLDLYGLGNYQIYKNRVFQENGNWMNDIVTQNSIELAMIYKNWFPYIPKNWVLLRCLTYDNTPLIGENTVYFYATDKKYVKNLSTKLDHFKQDPVVKKLLYDCQQNDDLI